MNDMERDRTMVQDLLELKGKVDSIIAESFQGRDSFSDVVRSGRLELQIPVEVSFGFPL